MAGLAFYSESESFMGQLYGTSGSFSLIGQGDMLIRAYGTNHMQGNINFSYATISGLTVSQIEGLRNELESIKSELRNHTHTVNIGTHNHGNSANQNWGGTFTTSTP
ncbi:hypothetical protein D3C74_397620 [compost metagenome]